MNAVALATRVSRVVLAAGAALLAAACDDGTRITRVTQDAAAKTYLTTAGSAGLSVEVHGAPFDGYGVNEIVALLKPPPGMAQNVRFTVLDPDRRRGRGRLLLVFNRADVVDPVADCRRSGRGEPLPVLANDGTTGFTVTASICDGAARIASAHMAATKTEAADTEELARVMRVLLRHLLDEPV